MGAPLRSGFTLMEMLWALALLAVGALSLTGVLIYGLRLSGQNREATAASQLAQQLFERVRGSGARIPAGVHTFRGASHDPQVGNFPPAPYPSVQVGTQIYNFEVHTEPVTGRASLFAVTARVSWNGDHQVVLQTYFFQP